MAAPDGFLNLPDTDTAGGQAASDPVDKWRVINGRVTLNLEGDVGSTRARGPCAGARFSRGWCVRIPPPASRGITLDNGLQEPGPEPRSEGPDRHGWVGVPHVPGLAFSLPTWRRTRGASMGRRLLCPKFYSYFVLMSRFQFCLILQSKMLTDTEGRVRRGSVWGAHAFCMTPSSEDIRAVFVQVSHARLDGPGVRVTAS